MSIAISLLNQDFDNVPAGIDHHPLGLRRMVNRQWSSIDNKHAVTKGSPCLLHVTLRSWLGTDYANDYRSCPGQRSQKGHVSSHLRAQCQYFHPEHTSAWPTYHRTLQFLRLLGGTLSLAIGSTIVYVRTLA